MSRVITLDDNLAEILAEIEKLSREEQKLLLLKLKRGELLEKAKVLQQKVSKNNITVDEIVKVVNANRKRA